MSNNWLSNPTKKQLISVIAVWVVAVLFIVIGRTDFFTQPFKFSVVFAVFAILLVVPSLLAVIETVKNYKKAPKV